MTVVPSVSLLLAFVIITRELTIESVLFSDQLHFSMRVQRGRGIDLLRFFYE